MINFSNLKQRGDTIVEVLVAIAIMGLALGAAYALSSRAFHTAQHTQERTEALTLAQGQVEFLRNAGLNDTVRGLIARYPSGSAFCFKDDDGADVAVTNDYCDNYGTGDASPYDVSIVYCDGSAGCGPANVYTITVTWIGVGGSGDKNLKLYYKPPLPPIASPSPPVAAGCVAPPPINQTFPGDLGNGSFGTTNNHQFSLGSPLAVGCSNTTLTVTTEDPSHASPPARPLQVHEQLFVEGYSGAVLVFTTGVTDDIPLADTEITTIFSNVPVTAPVDRLDFKHCSIHPNPAIAVPCQANTNSIANVSMQITQTP